MTHAMLVTEKGDSGHIKKMVHFSSKKPVETTDPETSARAQKRAQNETESRHLHLIQVCKTNASALSKRLGIKAKDLTDALVFHSKHVPFEFRVDMAQTIAARLLDQKPPNAAYAWTIGKGCVYKFWELRSKADKYGATVYSLDSVLDRPDYDSSMLETQIIGLSQFETMEQIEGKLDSKRIWKLLPSEIKAIVAKRLAFKGALPVERKRLERWLKKEGTKLISQHLATMSQ